MIPITEEADLLAFLETAGTVVDRYFVRGKPGLGELAGKLDVQFESVAGQVEMRQAGAAEDLEHGHDVGRVLPVQEVVRAGEYQLRDVQQPGLHRRLSVSTDLPAAQAKRAGTEHEFGSPSQDRSEQRQIVLHVVFEIRVLNQHDRPRDRLQSLSDRMSL